MACLSTSPKSKLRPSLKLLLIGAGLFVTSLIAMLCAYGAPKESGIEVWCAVVSTITMIACVLSLAIGTFMHIEN